MLARLVAAMGRPTRTIRTVEVATDGRAPARVVWLFAAVLGLNTADFATVSATAGNLESAFGIDNTRIGLLISVVSLVTALGTLPVGVLTDRTRRTRLLAGSILVWSVALLLSGIAGSYLWLVLSRLALGVASATTGPTVSSLVGDFYPAADRSRIYGLILGGELAGAGAGFVVSGEISSILPWPFAFWWLVLPGAALALAVWRLPEPARGAQRRLALRVATETGRQTRGRDMAQQALGDRDVTPRRDLILTTDPARWSVWQAIRYVLRIPTNVIIIVASALGYFFFAGLRSFAIIYLTVHYGLVKPVASLLVLLIGVGAVAGVLVGGRIADRSLRRGRLSARILVPLICLLLLAPVLAPAIATTSIGVALPLLTLGAALLGAPNPALDAARLDIVPPGLWGRAEAVRTVLRTLGEAAAPVLIGYLSEQVFTGPDAAGLRDTLLLCLIPLVASGLLVLPALRSYPRDVVTASASAEPNHGRDR